MIKPEAIRAAFIYALFALLILAAGCTAGSSSPAAQKNSPNMYDVLNSQRIEIFINNAKEIGDIQAEIMSGESADSPKAQALNKKTGWSSDQTRVMAMAIIAATELQADPNLAAIYGLPPVSKEQKALINKHQPALDSAVKVYKDSMANTFRQREKAGKKVPYRRSPNQS